MEKFQINTNSGTRAPAQNVNTNPMDSSVQKEGGLVTNGSLAISNYFSPELSLEEIDSKLDELLKTYGKEELVKLFNNLCRTSKNVISRFILLLLGKNPKLKDLPYKKFLQETGLIKDCFCDQTLIMCKNAFNVLSELKNKETLKKEVVKLPVSTLAVFNQLTREADFAERIEEFLKMENKSRPSAHSFVNGILYPQKSRAKSCKNNCAKAELEFPNRFGNFGDGKDADIPKEDVPEPNQTVAQNLGTLNAVNDKMIDFGSDEIYTKKACHTLAKIKDYFENLENKCPYKDNILHIKCALNFIEEVLEFYRAQENGKEAE